MINPTRPESYGGGASKALPEPVRMMRGIRAACVLYAVYGVAGVVFGIMMLLDPGRFPDAAWMHPAVLIGLIVCGAAILVSSIGVLCKRAWGIPVCWVISAFSLFNIPIGTIAGVYFLMNIEKVKDQFARRGGPAMNRPHPESYGDGATEAPPGTNTIARNIRAICILCIVIGCAAAFLGTLMLCDPTAAAEVHPAIGVGVLVGGVASLTSGVGVLYKRLVKGKFR